MNYTKILYGILIAGLLLLLIIGGIYAAFIGLGFVYIIAILDDLLGRKFSGKKLLTKTMFLILGLLFLYFALRFL
ncbi:hypothetical protein [Listeria rustica]|uniref:Uncharacterized protein n=1 Tax=Listeria rustica TaxID=2713503 RepID=A0A7W1YEQ0_9LIST|nr:hypothetical protein [Listeria rustica]MBA3924827.1 hypothetical protein [Listeria rustica]